MRVEHKNPQNFGQITFFFVLSFFLFITFLAVIINVGLFVKAKINLQNAVDAAAYAGAATQSRRLTEIAYLNWELRRIYKEWMFKYYVLGQAATDPLSPTAVSKLSGKNQTLNFRLRPFEEKESSSFYNKDAFDPFNVPSVCYQPPSETNLCRMASTPGIPQFPTLGMPNIGELHNKLVETISQEAAKDCSDRSAINFNIAMAWIFGTTSRSIPLPKNISFGTEQGGAYIRALELAFRIRNLEYLLNSPPKKLLNVSTVSSFGNKEFPLEERSILAFESAYKNLDSSDDSPFKNSLEIEELAPTDTIFPEQTLSGLLAKNMRKYYVDLQAVPLNLVNFFTFFSSRKSTLGDIQTQATCFGVKTAIPVPGHIFGFIKNPNFMTYYAVKGTATFRGLFFPFVGEGIKLTAYAAAKPFGGRIGPALFKVNNETVELRTNPTRSLGHASALAWDEATSTRIKSLAKPIPTLGSFWADPNRSVVGGVPSSGAGKVAFILPNLIYDFQTPSDLDSLGANGGQSIDLLTAAPSLPNSLVEQKSLQGLYNSTQFQLFYKNLGNLQNQFQILQNTPVALLRVSRPTKFEALNYLIPFPQKNNFPLLPDTLGAGAIHPKDEHLFTLKIFAPLYHSEGLYKNMDDISNALVSYVRNGRHSMELFSLALKKVAEEMEKESKLNAPAANLIFPLEATPKYTPENIASQLPDLEGKKECHKASLASRFAFFLLQDGGKACGTTPLSYSLKEYWEQKTRQSQDSQLFYSSSFVPYLNSHDFSSSQKVGGGEISLSPMLTAYSPGIRSRATENFQLLHPTLDSVNLNLLGKRSSYSTKFFPLRKVVAGNTSDGYGQHPLYSEANKLDFISELKINSSLSNPLSPESIQNLGELDQLHF